MSAKINRVLFNNNNSYLGLTIQKAKMEQMKRYNYRFNLLITIKKNNEYRGEMTAGKAKFFAK